MKVKGKDKWNYFKPVAPTNLSGSAGNTQVVLTWTAASTVSQIPVIDYIVQYSADNGITWIKFNKNISSSTSTTVTNLTNGISYLFKVAAVNGVGTGAYTETISVTPAALISLTYLLIGGGGGGGPARGGGGGAGGYLYGTGNVVLGNSLSVVVGNGGGNAQNGESSSFDLASGTVTALGGGRGADGLSGLFNGVGQAGGTGGSGGGGSGYPPVGAGGSGSQGNAGGAGYGAGEPYNGGGGGGAGGAGSSGAAAGGGVGRSTESAFLAAASAGVDVNGVRYIAAGGAAGSYNVSPGTGGLGGGGNGGNTSAAGGSGVANTGSGGGGGGNGANGGSGGSGVVILRVADTFTATTTGSPSVYVTGGYRYYKFTTNGTITFAV